MYEFVSRQHAYRDLDASKTMRVCVAIAIAATVVFVGRPSAAQTTKRTCSEGEQLTVRRLVNEHRKKIEEAEASVDRQRAVDAEEVLRTGHLSYANDARLTVYKRELAEWRQVADRDSARYTECFGYPPIALAGLGTAKRGFAQPKRAQREEKTNWSGEWHTGAYTVQMSGGDGSLDYTFKRNDGLDSGSASCKVQGRTATCTESGLYQDGELTVKRTSKTKLTLLGDSISETGEIVEATATKDGKPCPDAAQCTRLHAGAPLVATWTKQKP